jgi:hypothetical protein
MSTNLSQATKYLFVLLIGISGALISGCGLVVRRVNVNGLLPVNEALSTDDLIARINSFSETQTFAAQADVTVISYFAVEGAEADKFPAATGIIRFKRPENTRMNVTFIGTRVAEMVSDGHMFKLKILRPEDKRRFIYGSNLADIERLNAQDIQRSHDSQLAKAGGLVNMRPQHITDSFLIKPIAEAERPDVFREEVRQVEADTRSGKKNRMVERSYYVLYVPEREQNGHLRLRRKFWFDRSRPGTPLVRQQTFENGVGRLASDVTYDEWFAVTNSKSPWPGHVVIDRRNDGYRLDLRLVRDSVEANAELPLTTFTLENDENLEEINLDAGHKASTPAPPRKPQTPMTANR